MRTVAGIEASAHQPTTNVLDRLLAAAALDVMLVHRPGRSESSDLVRHLRLSLTQRLRIALGESTSIYANARRPAWRELTELSRCGQVVLERPLAHAIWIPLGRVAPLRVTVHGPGQLPQLAVIETSTRDTRAAQSLVAVAVDHGRQVWVAPPAELAMPDDETTKLLQAAELLDTYAARDDAQRRRPAHRDPDERDEERRLLVTKSVTDRPDLRDGRAWRIGAAASLAQRMQPR